MISPEDPPSFCSSLGEGGGPQDSFNRVITIKKFSVIFGYRGILHATTFFGLLWMGLVLFVVH